MLCIRGIVSRDRSIFIYLVCTLCCLFKAGGLADVPVAFVEVECLDALRMGLWEME